MVLVCPLAGGSRSVFGFLTTFLGGFLAFPRFGHGVRLGTVAGLLRTGAGFGILAGWRSLSGALLVARLLLFLLVGARLWVAAGSVSLADVSRGAFLALALILVVRCGLAVGPILLGLFAARLLLLLLSLGP